MKKRCEILIMSCIMCYAVEISQVITFGELMSLLSSNRCIIIKDSTCTLLSLILCSVLLRYIRAIFIWLWNENTPTKQKQETNGIRAVWVVYQIDTNVHGFWLVNRTLGWKNFMPQELSRNQWILHYDIILQHNWPMEECLLHIRVFFGGKLMISSIRQ